MGCNQSKKIDPVLDVLDTSIKYTENELIKQQAQFQLNNKRNINNIKFIIHHGDNYYYYYDQLFCKNSIEDIPNYNKYYNLFDFMIKNGYVLKNTMFHIFDIEHIKILIKYNYRMTHCIQYLVFKNNIDILQKISDIYNFTNFKGAFLNTTISLKTYYVIALFITKGYKLSDEELKYMNLKF
jgi:hypothetical protein